MHAPRQPGPGEPPAATPPAFNPAEMLARVWQASLPLVRTRVAQLEQAAQAALAGDLTPDALHEAVNLAHKLAGSLGMFGYPRGTEIAREIEAMLGSEGPLDQARFLQLTADLRSALPL